MSVLFNSGKKVYEISHAKIAQRLAERSQETTPFLREFKKPLYDFKNRHKGRYSHYRAHHRPMGTMTLMRQARRPRWAKHYERTTHSALLGAFGLLTFPWLFLAFFVNPLAAIIISSGAYVLTNQIANAFSWAAWRGAESDPIVDEYISTHFSEAQFNRADVIEGYVRQHLYQAGLLGKLMLFMASPSKISLASLGLKSIAIVMGSFVGLSLLGLMPLSPLLTLVFAGLSALSWASSTFREQTSVPVADVNAFAAPVSAEDVELPQVPAVANAVVTRVTSVPAEAVVSDWRHVPD